MTEQERAIWLAGRDAAVRHLEECADNVVRNASAFQTAAYPARMAMYEVARLIKREVLPPDVEKPRQRA